MLRPLLGVLFCLVVDTTRAHPEVTLPDGSQLVGRNVGTEAAFRGVRYAAPPVGNLRWTPPQAYVNADPSWPVEAAMFGDHCTQSSGGSEDCLYLNVFVGSDVLSAAAQATPLPVAIFIHGSDYQSGSAAVYDGPELLQYWGNAVVVVTINYRLGVFGFLGAEELRAQDAASGSTGNYGLQDQRMAMEWVQANIAAFGGDKDRAMIYDGGAGSVANHLAMPKSWSGLFNSAVMEVAGPNKWVIEDMAASEDVYSALLLSAGCANVNCLLALGSDYIFSHAGSSPYLPTADGVETSTQPWAAVASNDIADVPVMLGSKDGTISIPRQSSEEELVAQWTEQVGSGLVLWSM